MSLASHVIRRFAGLFTGVNVYGLAPEGAAALAENCSINRRDVVEPRPGYSALAADLPANALAWYQGRLVTLDWTSGQLRQYVPGSGWAALPWNPAPAIAAPALSLPFGRPAGQAPWRTRFVSSQRALYWQGPNGLTKLEGLVGARPALQPLNLSSSGPGVGGGSYVSAGLGTGGWLAAGAAVAYRITVCRYGANEELIESEPSDRIVYINALATVDNPVVNVRTGWMVPVDAFFRVYRTKQIAAGADPGDEEFLVAEVLPTGSRDLYNFMEYFGYAHATDYTPDGLLGAALYTNAITGSAGAGMGSAPAPLSADLALFKDRFYALNTTDVQRLQLKVIGTGTGGIQVGDTITVAGVTFTFNAQSTGFPSATDTWVYTGGTVAQNIDNTARLLVARINDYFLQVSYAGDLRTGILARYLSSGAGDVGQVLLQRVLPGAEPFAVSTSSGAGWDADYTTAVVSDPNRQLAGLAWSQPSEPEAWPLGNTAPVGDQSKEGLRLIALREAMFVFKEDGVWRVTDDGSLLGPAITLYDPTVRLLARETAVAIDNVAIGLTDQGVLALSEMGKQNLSADPIGQELANLVKYVGAGTMDACAFAIANEADRQYLLAVPESPSATSASRVYCYSLATQAWTTWSLPALLSGGVVPDTRQVAWGVGTWPRISSLSNTVWLQRRDGNDDDYQDPGFTVTSPATTATKTLVFSGVQPIDVGDLVLQWQATYALRQRVTAVSYNAVANQTTVTLDAAPAHAWTSAALTIIKAIQSRVRFLPVHAGEPLSAKDWGDCYLAFRYLSLDAMTVAWSSELYQLDDVAAEQVANYGASGPGARAPIPLVVWSTDAWGSALWGRQTKDVVLKATRPAHFNYAALLQLELLLPCVLQRYELAALDFKLGGATDRVVR